MVIQVSVPKCEKTGMYYFIYCKMAWYVSAVLGSRMTMDSIKIKLVEVKLVLDFFGNRGTLGIP